MKKKSTRSQTAIKEDGLFLEKFGSVTMEDGAVITMAKISMDKVVFNPYNPNVMDEKTFEALKSNIKESKYLELAVVHLNSEMGNFTCIDGEHRLLVLKDMGVTEPVVSVIEGISDLTAYSGAYTFNKIKGQIDSGKLSKMMKYGTENWGAKQILKSFGMQKYKYDEIMLQFQAEAEEEVEGAQGKVEGQRKKMEKIADSILTEQTELKSKTFEETTQLIMINLPPKKHKIVTKILAAIDSDISEALYKLCKAKKLEDEL